MWWSITSANYCILVTFYIFFITDNSPLYKLDQGLNPALALFAKFDFNVNSTIQILLTS